MAIKDFSDINEVKAALEEAEKTRKGLVKKLDKARGKTCIHIGRYDNDTDSSLDTSVAATKKTETALKELTEAFTALEDHVHNALEIAEEHQATPTPDTSLVISGDVIGQLEDAYRDTKKYTKALETLAARRIEEIDRQKTARALDRAEKHPETAPAAYGSATWKPQSIFHPGELGINDDLSTATCWTMKLKSYIRPEDVKRFGDTYFQTAIYNLMTQGVRDAIQFNLLKTIPIYTSSTLQSSVVDQITAIWKITHSPELLEAEWYTATQMEDEPFASWDARMVTLAANAELLKSYGGDQNLLDKNLGNRLLAGLTGEEGRLIHERVIRAQSNDDGQGHHILTLVRKIAKTEEVVKARTKHLRVQTGIVYKLHGGASSGGASNTNPDTRKCYNCQKEGHIASNCTEPKGPDRRPKGPWMQHLAESKLCFRCAKKHDKMCNSSSYVCEFCKKTGHLEDACQLKHKDFQKPN